MMNIIVFGATGATGKQVVEQALADGHQVTAFVRDPSKVQLDHPRLRLAAGQVTADQKAVTAAVAGHDAVISALGNRLTYKGLRTPSVIADATAIITRAMEETGVDRLVFLSAFGVGDTIGEAPLPLKVMYRMFLGPGYADKSRGERILRAGELNWTLVYPVLLTNGPRTGAYRVGDHLRLKGLAKISRADVADFMLRQLDDATYIRRTAIVAD
jgi:putative NADH-flavin reductase